MYCMNHNEAQIYLHGSVSDERRGTELTDWGRRSHLLYVCKQGQALAIYPFIVHEHITNKSTNYLV